MKVEFDQLKEDVIRQQNEELKNIAIGYRDHIKKMGKEIEEYIEMGMENSKQIRRQQKKIDCQREMLKAKDKRLEKYKRYEDYVVKKDFSIGKSWLISLKKKVQKTA